MWQEMITDGEVNTVPRYCNGVGDSVLELGRDIAQRCKLQQYYCTRTAVG